MKDGDSAWYASTVPVGRSCARFAALDMTLSVAVAAGPAAGAGSVVGTSSTSLGVVGAVGWLPLVRGVGGIWITVEDGDDDAIVLLMRDILSCSILVATQRWCVI